MADSKNGHFPAPPILNIFSLKFHGLVLGLVELIDAKGISEAIRHKLKKSIFVFLGCFGAYVGQPHGHMG